MDTRQRLKKLLSDSGWTEYRLAINCGLSQSTIANIFHRNTVPSIETLETICKGFGITLSQFFAEDNLVEVSPDLKEVFDLWVDLSPDKKALFLQMLRSMNNRALDEKIDD